MNHLVRNLTAAGILASASALGLSAQTTTTQTTQTTTSTTSTTSTTASVATPEAYASAISTTSATYQTKRQALETQRAATLAAAFNGPPPTDHKQRQKMMKQLRAAMQDNFSQQEALHSQQHADLEQLRILHHKQVLGTNTTD